MTELNSGNKLYINACINKIYYIKIIGLCIIIFNQLITLKESITAFLNCVSLNLSAYFKSFKKTTLKNLTKDK